MYSSLSQLSATPVDGLHTAPKDGDDPSIYCNMPDPDLPAASITESDCNYLIAYILTRKDVMSVKTFFQLGQANTSTVPSTNGHQTLQLPARFQTPWKLDRVTCKVGLYQIGKEEDNFRLVEVARQAALILAKFRDEGPPYRGGTVRVGPEKAFLVAVRGIIIIPPPVT